MDRVVYLLGAGFSAPLGLPVVANFLMKSRDLHYSNPENYAHFRDVLETIQRLSYAKNYFSVDTHDIEEIFSILEMDQSLKGQELSENFTRYVCDVITHFTPEIKPYGVLPANWNTFVFGRDDRFLGYGTFVASLFGLEIDKPPSSNEFTWKRTSQACASYDVISLNYDCVIENIAAFIVETFRPKFPLKFCRSKKQSQESTTGPSPWLAKLHGSVDDGHIVPPTWKKSVTPAIEEQWNAAHGILSNANHIRVIGYSLPVADAYVKYLLKSAVLDSRHLKTIDILLLDPSLNAISRYREFVTFKYARVANVNVKDYLTFIANEGREKPSSTREKISYNRLEDLHESFMAVHAKSLN